MQILNIMLEKIKTVYWYLRQPKLYPEFAQLVKTRLFPVDEKREEATLWCSSHAVSVEEAYQRITNNKIPFRINSNFRKEFDNAEKKVSQFPSDRGGPGDIDLLYHLCEHKNAFKVLETGVAYGWSSLALLLSLQKKEKSLLLSTDMPYAKMDGKDYVGCVVPDSLKENWKLIRLPDRQGLPKAISILGEIDLCHYDSDKSYEGRVWAYPKLWNALSAGGIFISDDIGDNFAFKHFSEKIGCAPIIVKSDADRNVTKYVGILIK